MTVENSATVPASDTQTIANHDHLNDTSTGPIGNEQPVPVKPSKIDRAIETLMALLLGETTANESPEITAQRTMLETMKASPFADTAFASGIAGLERDIETATKAQSEAARAGLFTRYGAALKALHTFVAPIPVAIAPAPTVKPASARKNARAGVAGPNPNNLPFSIADASEVILSKPGRDAFAAMCEEFPAPIAPCGDCGFCAILPNIGTQALGNVRQNLTRAVALMTRESLAEHTACLLHYNREILANPMYANAVTATMYIPVAQSAENVA